MMLSIMSGSLIRETPPWARMSAGTRSSAITATAPASSAIFACSAVTTSMITPPLSISASPALTRKVPSSFISAMVARPRGRPASLLEAEGLDAIRVGRLVERVDPVGERLHDAEQRGMRAHVGGAVRRVVQLVVGQLRHLGEGGVGHGD